jgi:hypothetical protein
MEAETDSRHLASFLRSASSALTLPYPGTGPEYGHAFAWVNDQQTRVSFPDCVENSTRQIVSLFFLEFAHNCWSFDIGAIRTTAARGLLGDFFESISPSDLMREDGGFRTKWSRVMASLEGGDGVPSPIYVRRTPNGRLENECRAGLISQTRAVAALFKQKSDVSVDWSVEEVASELERLLNLVNPQRCCTVTVVEWWAAKLTREELPEPDKEYGGHFWIQVMSQKTRKVVGSCLLRETETIGHSEILGIRVFPEGFASQFDSQNE